MGRRAGGKREMSVCVCVWVCVFVFVLACVRA